MRILLVAAGVANLVLAVGYSFQMPWTVNTWPWPDGRLSYLFVGSILAAIGAATLWIGVSGEWEPLAAGALNLIVMMGGLAAFFFLLAGRADQPRLLAYAVGVGLFALFNLGLFLRAHRLPARNPIPTPRLVSVSYGLFAAILVLIGVALILKTPNIMPWPLKPETSVVFGWIFLGDAFYFLYGLLRPSWQYARAQLWSFLAYDLVLIGPFLAHLSNVRPELLINLLVYLVVLVYSGGLAIYYLFVNEKTRAWPTG